MVVYASEEGCPDGKVAAADVETVAAVAALTQALEVIDLDDIIIGSYSDKGGSLLVVRGGGRQLLTVPANSGFKLKLRFRESRF